MISHLISQLFSFSKCLLKVLKNSHLTTTGTFFSTEKNSWNQMSLTWDMPARHHGSCIHQNHYPGSPWVMKRTTMIPCSRQSRRGKCSLSRQIWQQNVNVSKGKWMFVFIIYFTELLSNPDLPFFTHPINSYESIIVCINFVWANQRSSETRSNFRFKPNQSKDNISCDWSAAFCNSCTKKDSDPLHVSNNILIS